MKQESYMYICILAFLTMASRVIAAAPSEQAGICYGLLGDNLPAPSQVISTLETCGIAKFRIYEPHPEILQQNSRLVSLTVKNQDLPSLAVNADAAKEWVKENYIPYPNIYEIVVGNEVIPSKNAQYVVNAMINIQSAISQTANPSTPVTTSISSAALVNTYPPSQSTFGPDSIGILTQLVQLFNSNPSWAKRLYVNIYPYFAYASDPTHIPLDYVLFQSSVPVVADMNLEYYNLFDAIFDGFVWALEKIGGADVGLTVGETGWPSAGNGGLTTPALASTYNTNLYNHLVNNNGSPKRPKDGFDDFYIFAMFNENQKPAGVEQNWGLFDSNLGHLYATPLC